MIRLEFINYIGSALISIGLIGGIIKYSITFTGAKLNERRMQRRELQYLYSSLAFVLVTVLTPFMISFILIKETFPNLINDDTVYYFIKIVFSFGILQFINLILIYLFGFDKINKSTNKVVSFITKHKKRILSIGFLVAFFTSIFSSMFIIMFFNIDTLDSEQNLSATFSLFIIYLFLFIPYYGTLAKKVKREVLVEVHLTNGDILTNLFMSHRTFGKDLVFYDTTDKLQQKAVTISKNNIQFIISVEHPTDKKISKTKRKLSRFSTRVIKEKDNH